MADRTGESGEPCRVPLVMLKGSDVYVPKLSEAIQLVRKERVQAHMLGGKPRLRKVCVTR